METTLLTITAQEEVAPAVRRLRLAGALPAEPGQFIQVAVSSTHDPLLRRPLSVHDRQDGQVVLLYRITGRGTGLLAQKKPGERLDVLGPLGRGFPLPEKGTAVLVAGGMGIAPLFFLARVLGERGVKVSLLFGARAVGELFLREELSSIACRLLLATEDGSAGHFGLVTELLPEILVETDGPVFACGPEAMLRRTAALCGALGRACYVSLESHMACGVGACLGCTVALRRNGENVFARVCTDGPVFPAGEVFPFEA